MSIGKLIAAGFRDRPTGGTVFSDSIEVFRPNAEKSAQRAAEHRTAVLSKYQSEFHSRQNRTWVDAIADSMNRLVRPVVSFGLLYPIIATVWAPEQMAQVWVAIATLPAGYWAVVGIVLPFYFGGRMQTKALEASHWLAASRAATDLIAVENDSRSPDRNQALHDWKGSQQE